MEKSFVHRNRVFQAMALTMTVLAGWAGIRAFEANTDYVRAQSQASAYYFDYEDPASSPEAGSQNHNVTAANSVAHEADRYLDDRNEQLLTFASELAAAIFIFGLTENEYGEEKARERFYHTLTASLVRHP